MKTTIQIKSIFGKLLFEFEKENNTIKDTVEEAVKNGANLYRASLDGANLDRANLSGASLYRASLDRANLDGANLYRASLDGASLNGASLDRANLDGASLDRANLSRISKLNTIVPEGELIVWKALQNGLIVKLIIPAKAKRVNAIGSRKCRFEYAIVDAIYDGKKKVKQGRGIFNREFIYEVGKEVRPDKFDPDSRVECSHGIHAFITRLEATEYNQ